VQFGKPGVSKALNAVREPCAGKARTHGSSGAAFPRGNVATFSLWHRDDAVVTVFKRLKCSRRVGVTRQPERFFERVTRNRRRKQIIPRRRRFVPEPVGRKK